jgi:hypothetical protein
LFKERKSFRSSFPFRSESAAKSFAEKSTAHPLGVRKALR